MKTIVTKSGYRVYQVLKGRCNVFLVSNGTNCMLVDTGRKNKWNELSKKLSSCYSIKHLDALILTHTHFDHAENAARVASKYNAPIVVHESEAAFLQEGSSQLPARPIVLERILKTNLGQWIQKRIRYEPASASVLVTEKLDLSIYGFLGYIMHTPGHSSGSQCVIIDDEVAFVGDTMYGVLPNNVKPPFYNNAEQLKKSIKRLSQTGCKVFYPSHGRPLKKSLVIKKA
ncbi:MAG: MBL fold metallo-hydrolase [Bacteroidales bacterium]|nr:MBL fold metallo-hydrolase [Bacteroidales bacterium]